MLKYLRIAVEVVVFLLIVALFVDFSGTIAPFAGWLAKIQLLPAVLSLNVLVLVLLVIATLLFGRLYCSIVCPLGMFQDIFAAIGLKTVRRNKYSFRKENPWLRGAVLIVYIVMLVLGMASIASIIEPYGAFGRMATNLQGFIHRGFNNILAANSEHENNYDYYMVTNQILSWTVFGIASCTFVVLALLSFFFGRWWCSNICPVGTTLSLFSRFSLFRPVINTSKCNGCQLCARNCKASCINPKEHTIDMSNCVVCFDCINNCRQGAIKYKVRSFGKKTATVDASRRNFVVGTVAAGSVMAVEAAARPVTKTVDGGFALLEDKKAPKRSVKLRPAGSWSAEHFAKKCTACQLCVSSCPNGILRPSGDLQDFMTPVMGYEVGHCRPECTRCADVCPTGAIKPITREEKSSIQIGHAVWIPDNCVVLTDGVSCGNCARHCPVGAISMVEHDGHRVPSVDTERCIGCGACEHLCPSRPYSAIYVEGHKEHRKI